MRRVIYTAIFGNKEPLREPKFRPPGCDFICFTDSDFKSKTWEVKKIAPPHIESRRAARHVKILAHKYLPEYDQSCWIDGNLIVGGDVNELFDKYLVETNLGVFNHANTPMDPLLNLKQEAEYLIRRTHRGKFEDDPQLITKQLNTYKADGFPDNNGLAITMIMLRNHNRPDVVQAMELWWKQIQEFTNRDQMSFNYIMWKTGLNFKYMDGDSRDNPYFQWVPHEDISYLVRKWHKLIKILGF